MPLWLKKLVILFDSQQPIPLEIVLLLAMLGLLIFMWDLFDRRSRKIRERSGFDAKTELVALQGSTRLRGKTYFSETEGLISRPDALIKKEGFIIPVSVQPMSKKIHDRHIVQMLVHMRLIEEVEGKRPPYGILLMGQRGRIVRVQNTPQKQFWLSTLLDEMRSIMDGVPALPKPAPLKCKHCDVREICKHSVYRGG